MGYTETHHAGRVSQSVSQSVRQWHASYKDADRRRPSLRISIAAQVTGTADEVTGTGAKGSELGLESVIIPNDFGANHNSGTYTRVQLKS